jgi:thiamine-monophosphate kinase
MAQRSEFELIRQFFSAMGADRADVLLGVGDDAALLDCGGPESLALCVDTLTAGVHFPPETPPAAVGHKALAVNLSDLAAMGARPAWALLALSMPGVDQDWLAGFSKGLNDLALAHGVALVGGDTTRGALAASITLAGLVGRADALRRDGARPGDGIYISGALGDAAAGLHLLQAGKVDEAGNDAVDSYLIERLQRPQPRVALGSALRGLASAAIDISDGLLADLGHILERSAVGATVDTRQLPLSGALRQRFSAAQAEAFALSGGDDYELCFTVPAPREPDLARAVAGLGVAVTRIGTIEAEPGLRLLDQSGQARTPRHMGYDHFGGQP